MGGWVGVWVWCRLGVRFKEYFGGFGGMGFGGNSRGVRFKEGVCDYGMGCVG